MFHPFCGLPTTVISGWTEVSRDANENSKVSEKSKLSRKDCKVHCIKRSSKYEGKPKKSKIVVKRKIC